MVVGLLTLNPNQRLTSADALSSEIFDDIRGYIENKYPAPEIYEPDCDEIFLLHEEFISFQPTTDINANMRQILLSWLLDVAEEYERSIRTYYLCVHLVDKYISLTPHVSRNDFQAVGICALSLASDFVDSNYVSLEAYADITDNTSTAEFLRQLKESMWKTLDFNLMVSTPWDFAVFYANNIELDEQLQDLYFDILFRITISPQRSGITVNISPIALARPHDLALACLINVFWERDRNINEKEDESRDIEYCFILRENHYELAEMIKHIWPYVEKL